MRISRQFSILRNQGFANLGEDLECMSVNLRLSTELAVFMFATTASLPWEWAVVLVARSEKAIHSR